MERPRWHPAQPHVVVHFDSNDDTVIRLQFTNVDTLVTSTVFTFSAQYERIRPPSPGTSSRRMAAGWRGWYPGAMARR